MDYLNWASIPIVKRLLQRFLIQKPPYNIAEAIPLLGSIQPVTNIDELLGTPDVFESGSVALVGIGIKALFTVPKGKRYRCSSFNAYQVSGDRTCNQMYVSDTHGHQTLIAQFTTAASVYTEVLGHPIMIEEGWSVDINLMAGETDGNWALKGLAFIEDAF